MKLLTIKQRATLVVPPGTTGACWADRWPNPRALLVETAGNYSCLYTIGVDIP